MYLKLPWLLLMLVGVSGPASPVLRADGVAKSVASIGALEHRAENALSITAETFGIDTICAGLDVDDKRFDSFALSMAAIDRRIAHVREVANVTLIKV